jgi:hypothetical protein
MTYIGIIFVIFSYNASNDSKEESGSCALEKQT